MRSEVKGSDQHNYYKLTLARKGRDWRILSRGGTQSALCVYVVITLARPERTLEVGSWRQGNQWEF